MKIDGRCHCGKISFTADVDPATAKLCHCTDCQILSGSAFRALVSAPMDGFVLRGEPSTYVKVAESGNRRAQVFCADCGTPIYSASAENPTTVVIRLGCVDQRAQLAPVHQMWLRSALPWLFSMDRAPGKDDGC